MAKESSQQHETNETVNRLSKKGNRHVRNIDAGINGVNVLVLDSAHSWLICLANFVILTFIASFSRLNYMTFLDLVQRFDVTITATSIGFTLQLISVSIMSTLVTSLVVPRTGERVACLVATCISCLSSFGIGLSPNIGVYILLMTVKGACVGAITVPSVAMLSKYFDQRRSLATAIACSGLAAGSMGGPPLIDVMLRNYGLEWAYILMAVMEMNGLWASMLLRPTSRYKSVRRLDDPDKHSNGIVQTTLDQLELQPLTEPLVEKIKEEQEENLESANCLMAEFVKNPSSGLNVTRKLDFLQSEKLDIKKESIVSPTTLNNTAFKGLIDPEFVYYEEQTLRSHQDVQTNRSLNLSMIHSDSTMCSQNHIEVTMADKAIGDGHSNGTIMESKYMSKTDPEDRYSQHDTRKGQSKTKTFLWSLVLGLYHAFNLNLLKTWSMRFLLFYCTTATVVMYVPSYLPTMGVKAGLAPNQVSLLLIASGGVDFVGRIALGAFADLKILTACQIVGISQILMGTICQFAVYYNTFGTMMVLAVSSGLLTGSRVGLASILCYEFVGPENLLKSFGVQTMLATLSLALHHPLLSSILEATGSFAPPLHYVGAAAYVSSIFLFLQPQAKRMDGRLPVVLG